MLQEVLSYLSPREGIYLDGTLGGGGYTQAILERSPHARVTAYDLDQGAINLFEQVYPQYANRVTLVAGSYETVNELDQLFEGAVLDLGLSSDQLEQSGRGFSFQRVEPLDLRFDPNSASPTAATFLARASYDELVRVFSDYAQDRRSKTLARKILEARRTSPIRTTTDLIQVIGTSSPKVLAPIWQALRIVVNDELGNLERGLNAIQSKLKVGAVLVVVSFHSLEDAIVKNFFKTTQQLTALTKKPITPSHEEVLQNQRCRSAKLRAAKKIMEENV